MVAFFLAQRADFAVAHLPRFLWLWLCLCGLSASRAGCLCWLATLCRWLVSQFHAGIYCGRRFDLICEFRHFIHLPLCGLHFLEYVVHGSADEIGLSPVHVADVSHVKQQSSVFVLERSHIPVLKLVFWY
jgi:hypothetical protein